MFTLVAAIVFFGAFLLAAGTIVGMFALYADKMVAALLFEPIPQQPRIYHVRISRPRVRALPPRTPRTFSPSAFAA